jgi:hypothetical protein
VSPPPFPAETAAARDFLRAAAADGARVTPCGRRSRLRRHRPHAAPDRWLDCTRFDGMVWLDAEDQTCEVGAGTAPAALDAALAPHGLMLAADAPCADAGTLGGLFLAPDLSLLHGAYGPPRDQVLGASWLLADGSVVRTGARVVKSVAGYDLTRLLLGSRGLLAACVTLVLRLQPRPRALHAARVRDPAALRGAGLPDPLWHFQEARGAAWAAWDGFLPTHPLLDPAAAPEFHAARLRTLAAFAAAPRRFAHARGPAPAPAGPMDWNAGQEACALDAVAPADAVAIPGRARPEWLDELAQACAPGAPPFAAETDAP